MSEEEIIQKCIEKLQPVINRQGSASVAWALKDINVLETQSLIEKVSAKLVESGEFIRTERGNDYYISKNPHFILNQSLQEVNISTIKTNQSLIEANQSSRDLNEKILPKNFNDQKKFGNRSLLLTGVSVLFIAVTAYLQYRDKTAQRVQELQQQAQQSRQSLDSIRISLERIDSSMRRIADSLP